MLGVSWGYSRVVGISRFCRAFFFFVVVLVFSRVFSRISGGLQMMNDALLEFPNCVYGVSSMVWCSEGAKRPGGVGGVGGVGQGMDLGDP